jgi:hypothetical protein
MSQRQELEQAGYVFEPADGGMALVDTDEDGNSYEVARFNPDGSVAIEGLGLDFQRADASAALLLTPDQMEREGIRIVSSPRKDGSVDVHIEKDKGNGEYETAAKYVDAKNAWLGIPDITAENLKYGEKELADFDGNLKIKTVTVGGEEMQGLVGIKADGSERVLALEMDGRMVRVGEWKDEKDRPFYVYVNPDYDPKLRVRVTPEAPRAYVNYMFEQLAKGQYKGESPQSLMDKFLDPNNNIENTMKIPVGNMSTEHEIARWRNRWITAPTTPDFSKPIEIMPIWGKEKVDELMKSEMGDKLLYRYSPDDPNIYNGIVTGFLYWVSTDGHVQLILFDSDNFMADALNKVPEDTEGRIRSTTKLEWKKHYEELLKGQIAWKTFAVMDTFSRYGSSEAFYDFFKLGYPRHDAKSRGLFNFVVEIEE